MFTEANKIIACSGAAITCGTTSRYGCFLYTGGRRQLLAISLGMCFFTVAGSVYADEAQPQVDTIDIIEAVRIAESLLSNELGYADDYATLELEIKDVVRYTTPHNWKSRERDGTTVYDPETGEPVPESEYYLSDKLAGRVYWLIYFTPTGRFVLDGAISYYIDAETSELIHVCSMC